MGAAEQGNAAVGLAAKSTCDPEHVDEVAEQAFQSILSEDWDTVRLLLHPYLHWTGPDDVTIWGRTQVLAMLTERPNPPGPPASVELRDSQVYRWRE
jgi:hypothetical protein